MRMTAVFSCVMVLLFAGSSTHAATASDVPLKNVQGAFNLNAYLQQFEDKSASLTIDTVRSKKFEHIVDGSPNYGFTDSAWWVRIKLTNDRSVPELMMLRQDYPLIDMLDLWEKTADGVWVVRETGDRRVFASRDIAHRDFVFPLSVPANSSKIYYLRYASSGALNISLSLYRPDALLERVSVEQLAFGIYFGGFLVLVIYNLFIFLAVRDKAFVYYLLYALFYGTYFAVHNGIAYQFFWPQSPMLANRSLVVLLALTLIFGLQFSRKILNTVSTAKRLDFFAKILLGLAAVGLIGGLFLPYATIILPLAALTLLIAIIILIMGTVSLLSGYKPARYFMVAWLALILGVIIYMLKTFALLPHNDFTQNAFQIGSLIEMVLLSLALASRVDELKRESVTDTLTNLLNRRYFENRFADEYERATRYSQPMCLLLIDIDLFKKFNDDHGHTLGDQVLAQVGRELKNTARNLDVVCRIGGEEFAVILPSTDREDGLYMAERLRLAVEKLDFSQGSVTVSIGLACSNDAVFESTVNFFEAADSALYAAKGAGRNQVVGYSQGMEAQKRPINQPDFS